MRTVTIINTGKELITGAVLDVNGPFLSRTLHKLGIEILARVIVGDDIVHLENSIRQAIDNSDCVIITGGLGPTTDDLTRETLKRISCFTLIPFAPALERMEKVFSGRGKMVDEFDLPMVMVPSDAHVFPNTRGIAPGFAIKSDDKYIIALPGPPAELEAMLTDYLAPWLANVFKLVYHAQSIDFNIIWMKESEINRLLEKLTSEINVQYGITTGRGIARVTFYSSLIEEYKKSLEIKMKELFTDKLLGKKFDSPEQELVSILTEKKLTIAAAESCTGGLAAKRITDIAGSSSVFTGSVVTYSNASKIKLLGVRDDTLLKWGAVSEETAIEMATGAKKLFGTDIAFSITGIAGPDGGTTEKPVGTVCFAFAQENNLTSRKLLFQGTREMIRTIASLYAINHLRIELLKTQTRKVT